VFCASGCPHEKNFDVISGGQSRLPPRRGREKVSDSRDILNRTGRAPLSKPVPLPPPGFDDLSIDEKIDYLQSLWDRIAATPETIPVPDWHREIIDERVKEVDANPDAGDDWEVVQERLRTKFDNRQ
jgi:putative addiction module component (TIGR02574 family)